MSIYLLVIALASLYSLFISVMMWFIPGEGWNKYGATHLPAQAVGGYKNPRIP